jgi:hypothetical protein
MSLAILSAQRACYVYQSRLMTVTHQMANISLTLNLQYMMALELFRNSNSVTLNKKHFVLKRRITIPHKQECRGDERISGSFKARKFRILFYKNNTPSHFLSQNKYPYTVQNLLHFHISSHTKHISTVSRSTSVPTLLIAHCRFSGYTG